jgi:hypothetical protein
MNKIPWMPTIMLEGYVTEQQNGLKDPNLDVDNDDLMILSVAKTIQH